MKVLSKEDIELLKLLARSPGMFLINKVEDYNLFIHGYSLSNEGKNLYDFLNEDFSSFLNAKEKMDGYKWYKIIRLNSSTNLSSLKLFKEYITEFLEIKGWNE